MLFSSKRDKNQTQTQIVGCIKQYFDLDGEYINDWINIEKHNITVTLPFVAQSQHDNLVAQLTHVLDDPKVSIKLKTQVIGGNSKVPKIPNVKNVIAVASGKGGVGKSTTSVNLAFALMAEGAKVGLLDADIYGPSIPIMLGNTQATPSSKDNKRVDPINAYGVVASSIGYFVPAENATVWRGPMASKALHQLINETAWPELDYLVVDMPPGTGDIQLTLAQQVPVNGAVIVSTPQDLALADATKGIAMFIKVDVPVLGVVENMSYYQCPNCGHQAHIFASGGAETLVEQHQTRLLGKIPLDIHIRQHADDGKPLQIDTPEHALSVAYRQLARQTAKYCYLNTVQIA